MLGVVRAVVLISTFFSAALGAQRPAGDAALAAYAEPSIAPDRSEIAFVSGGDIWTVAAGGGEARLLVSHEATEVRPLFSPDGTRIAFGSARAGNQDVWVLTLATGELTRLTYDDVDEQPDGWSADGRWIYFSSSGRDIAGMADVYRVSADGGTPMPVSADRYVTEFFAAPAPDGSAVAVVARGVARGQWWRRGHSHLDESEIWVVRDAGRAPRYERVSDREAKELWPMWSTDGRTLYFVSDRDGAENLWAQPASAGVGGARPITRFTTGRLLWPSISRDGKAIVFERDFRIWTVDPASGTAAEVPIRLRGAAAGAAPQHLALTGQFRDLALSPDGKKVAFVARGEVFAASAKDGGDATRLTTTPAAESQLAWAPDSRRIAYVSERDGAAHLWLYDFATRAETQLTRDSASDAAPRWSPDGKRLAFQRGGRELRVIELDGRRERALATGYFGQMPLVDERFLAWSPDGRWIAFTDIGTKGFTNVRVAPSSGGAARPVSFLANSFGGGVSWSPDGSYLLFTTTQRTEPGQVARIDLVPRTPKFREDQFRDLFREESPRSPRSPSPAPGTPQPADTRRQPASGLDSAARADSLGRSSKPVEIVFDDIRQRLSLLPTGVDANEQIISPDGKWLLLTAVAAGQENLYLYSLDELAREPAVARQLTSTAGAKSNAQFSPDGKEVFYLEQGRITSIPTESRQAKPLAVTAELDVDFAREKQEVFTQAWTYLRDHFHDPRFNGVDWPAQRRRVAPFIGGARTMDEVRRLASLMIGELNASHLGINPPAGGATPVAGRLGLRFDPAEYERGGHLRITEIIPLGPAALAREIKAGDYLVAVNGARIGTRTNLDALLAHTVGRRVALTVSSAAEGGTPREVAVRPVSVATEKALLYRAWVNENRAYVARVSGGRLGYVHMFDMGSASLAQLHVDLDAENHARDGVVVDVRNNNGGFVNAYALDVFARRPYLTMTVRGLPGAPARSALGQRALELPTILVTNQHSLSDAEDFTEGYRALKLGKVVGEPTAGWIIYTWNEVLLDGTVLRLPRQTITGSDGAPMEMHPRAVDVAVTRPLGESYAGRDSQLDAAVKELLAQLGNRTAGN